MIEAVQVQNILKRSHENKLAHAFLLETNDSKRCYEEVLLLIKNLCCPHTYEEQCKQECNICTLIDKDNLPSLVTINPDGQWIKKDQILNMMDKFSTKPVFTKFNNSRTLFKVNPVIPLLTILLALKRYSREPNLGIFPSLTLNIVFEIF